MSNRNCSVFGCTNTGRKCEGLQPRVKFYSFPARSYESERRQTWIKFCQRNNIGNSGWIPSKHSCICSRHFIKNEKSNHPHHPNFNPTIHPINSSKTSSSSRFQRCPKRSKTKVTEQVAQPQHTFEEPVEDQVKFPVKKAKPKNVFTQTNIEIAHKNEGPSFNNFFTGFDGIRTDEIRFKALTGISISVYKMLLDLFPKYFFEDNVLNLEDKLLLTLMKLKLGICFIALGSFFNVSGIIAKRTFSLMIDFLYEQTYTFIEWPSKFINDRMMHNCFKKDFQNCRVIINCTEIKTEKFYSVYKRKREYLYYKEACTIKYLIGMSPGGLVTFVSKGFSGKISDLQIQRDCGILKLLEPGDIVLADTGFAKIYSNFPNKNAQSSSKCKDLNRKIAPVREHIERITQRFKIFNILNNRFPNSLKIQADKIMKFIGVLVNLQPQIIQN